MQMKPRAAETIRTCPDRRADRHLRRRRKRLPRPLGCDLGRHDRRRRVRTQGRLEHVPGRGVRVRRLNGGNRSDRSDRRFRAHGREWRDGSNRGDWPHGREWRDRSHGRNRSDRPDRTHRSDRTRGCDRSSRADRTYRTHRCDARDGNFRDECTSPTRGHCRRPRDRVVLWKQDSCGRLHGNRRTLVPRGVDHELLSERRAVERHPDCDRCCGRSRWFLRPTSATAITAYALCAG